MATVETIETGQTIQMVMMIHSCGVKAAALASPLTLDVLPQPRRIRSFVESARRQPHDSLRSVSFAGPEVESVEFKEEYAGNEAGPLVAIEKRMVADNTRCVKTSHGENVRGIGIGVMLARPSERGFQEPSIT